MAANADIKLNKGWLIYDRLIDPKKFTSKLKKSVGRATEKNALIAVKAVREEIKAGVPPANAKLTRSIKGGGKPLVGTKGADLWNSVTSEVTDWNKAIVGVIRAGRGGFNVAELVHEGTKGAGGKLPAIRVTVKMRGMFMALFKVSQGKMEVSKLKGRAAELWEMSKRKKFYPLKESTKAIYIPPRPFLRYTFQDPKFKSAVAANWNEAVQKALSPRG